MNRRRRIAVLGAGPIGLEAALYARALGHTVTVYERGEVAASFRRFGFLRLFSPWGLNVSPLGLRVLAEAGKPAPDAAAFPTAEEFRRHYLLPLAAALGPAVETGVEVLGAGRFGLLKGDNIGGMRRARTPFRLLLRGGDGEREGQADVLLDATGVYSHPNPIGDGGVPALGEEAARARIDYHLPDVRGTDRGRFAGKHVLLVGAGFSAATTLLGLVSLLEEEPGTRVVWARRSSGPDPFPLYPADPLPERARLAREGNRLAAEPPAGCTVIPGVAVKAVSAEGERLRVELRAVDGGGTPETLRVERVIANVVYRPGLEILRELQVHQCYASEGPMNLAAALLKAGGGGDCLAQVSPGPEALKSPEPAFFILGHKSYGRRSDFLLRAGLEQVRDAFRVIEEDPGLDLYADGSSRLKNEQGAGSRT
jgi:hypothetical protein